MLSAYVGAKIQNEFVGRIKVTVKERWKANTGTLTCSIYPR